MIIWDFNVILALGITLCLGVVLACWVFYTLSSGPTLGGAGRPDYLRDREFFQQCGFCGYLYFDYLKRTPGHCPRCGSYQN